MCLIINAGLYYNMINTNSNKQVIQVLGSVLKVFAISYHPTTPPERQSHLNTALQDQDYKVRSTCANNAITQNAQLLTTEKKLMMKRITYTIFTVFLLLQVVPVLAQDNTSVVEKEIAYRKTIFERSAKIVRGLNLADSAKGLLITNIVAKQYRDLNDIYVLRDNGKATIKAETTENKQAADTRLKKLDTDINTKIDKLHPRYLKSLAKAGLTSEQIDQVKDGMTYNVLNVTINAYNSMMPNLTEPQKAQIMTWLTEAREHAMDAESSEKKHAWFGKYKGRINNYLSAQGIDMKKEEAAWMARLKEAKASQQ